MFKTETHMHTSESSICGKTSAIELMKIYHAAGYKTVFVSDHMHNKTMKHLGNIPWEEKVTIFFYGYYRAKKIGEELGMNVLPAAEITIKPNHYLAYNITREFLLEYPDIFHLTLEELSAAAKRHGVFLVQAHPHRNGKCFPTPEYVDGMEIYNSSPKNNDYSEKSEAVAREHGLCFTAGSDAHSPESAALTGLLSENEIKTVEDFIELLKSGKAQIIR